MVGKLYTWETGAQLEEHTKKKHSILSKYFRQYLITRCQLPQQERFRLAVVDGFSGAGKYKCGSFGSPLIFLDCIVNTANEINLNRFNQGLKPINIEFLLVLNDRDPAVLDQLKSNLAPHLLAASEKTKNVSINIEYYSDIFESVYPKIRKSLCAKKYSNVFFNLDQCGYSHVTSALIRDIMGAWKRAEVLLTFMIGSLLTYLSPDNEKSGVPLEPEVREKINLLIDDQSLLRKKTWLGEAELIVYKQLNDCAPFVSPFSINNPSGWQYWLMHFANVYRARQVYNNVLHSEDDTQTHYGRSGLNMLSYDPQTEGQLYLFNKGSRQEAKEALLNDIPRLIAESGDTLSIEDFYAAAYSETPAHSDDIHECIIESREIDVFTGAGGKRRQANSIRVGDTLKLKVQKSFFFSSS